MCLHYILFLLLFLFCSVLLFFKERVPQSFHSYEEDDGPVVYRVRTSASHDVREGPPQSSKEETYQSPFKIDFHGGGDWREGEREGREVGREGREGGK